MVNKTGLLSERIKGVFGVEERIRGAMRERERKEREREIVNMRRLSIVEHPLRRSTEADHAVDDTEVLRIKRICDWFARCSQSRDWRRVAQLTFC